MIFVKRDDLKTGMRLARPIYNRNGVLLYERNSKLTSQGIVSIKNFGLIGIFVLEPAEPVPPMTREDLEFERFQTMCVFSIQEELVTILRMGKTAKIPTIVSNIIKNYGHLNTKIKFMQNLRSTEDYFYKHSLNVAILCAILTHAMQMTVSEQLETVTAAIVHDIGKLSAPSNILAKDVWTPEERERVKMAEVAGFGLLEHIFTDSPNIKRICMQSQANLENLENEKETDIQKMLLPARVLCVAETFDTMTAMQVDKEPSSEVAALKYLMDHPDYFDENIVEAFCKSIKILFPGVSVELNNKEKALVLVENPANILEPMILTFRDNKLVDLYNQPKGPDRLEITDIMKTMDNRYVMDMDLLKKQGVEVEEPEYVDDRQEEEEYTSQNN
ncbi:MAG: HD domain-containing protein [Lachnospiraceae bacterium]|nr:HD domain-containing protein [Lachnospiraceae bacterium]